MTGLNKFGMEAHPSTKDGAKIISISAIDLNHKSNYQDFGRYMEVDLAITGDPEATLPELVEAVKKLITPDRRRALDERGKKIAEMNRQARARDRELAAIGWDASPVSTARLSAELWATDQKRRLVASFKRPLRQFLAHAPVEFQQTVSLHRSARRRRHRLPSPRRRRRGACE